MLIFNVIVSDGVSTDVSRVEITLIDINDNTPVFEEPVYTFPSINETARRNHVIGRIKATDLDLGPNSQIEYRLLTKDISGMFFSPPSIAAVRRLWLQSCGTELMSFRIVYCKCPVGSRYRRWQSKHRLQRIL